MSNIEDKMEAVEKWRNDNLCFLDGQPAKIVGWKEKFPTVSQINGPLAFEWSWAAVNRIMSGDRQFKSGVLVK